MGAGTSGRVTRTASRSAMPSAPPRLVRRQRRRGGAEARRGDGRPTPHERVKEPGVEGVAGADRLATSVSRHGDRRLLDDVPPVPGTSDPLAPRLTTTTAGPAAMRGREGSPEVSDLEQHARLALVAQQHVRVGAATSADVRQPGRGAYRREGTGGRWTSGRPASVPAAKALGQPAMPHARESAAVHRNGRGPGAVRAGRQQRGRVGPRFEALAAARQRPLRGRRTASRRCRWPVSPVTASVNPRQSMPAARRGCVGCARRTRRRRRGAATRRRPEPPRSACDRIADGTGHEQLDLRLARPRR